MSVPNLKWIALFVEKLLGWSQNFEFGSRDQSHADLGGRFMGLSRTVSEMNGDFS